MAQTVAALDSPLSLRLGCVLGFRRVCAESTAWVGCLGSAESLPSLRPGLCAWVPPSLCQFPRAIRIRDFLSRSRREWQPAITSFLESELDPAGATTLSFARD